MKSAFLCSILFWVTACHQGQQVKGEAQSQQKDTVKRPRLDFTALAFASPKDLACGMPLSAGVGDTAHYHGKLYGFCSKECKEEFLKNPSAYLISSK
jgi:YHS domain-containing protein